MLIQNRKQQMKDTRNAIMSSGQKLRLKMTKGPSKYFMDKFGGIHFVKISSGRKAIQKLGWREIDWNEAHNTLMKKSWREKK